MVFQILDFIFKIFFIDIFFISVYYHTTPTDQKKCFHRLVKAVGESTTLFL
jgi:hypothetical protein